MLDEKLLRAISRGRCFVLVGSGPSCEMGYPSWKKLAEDVYKELTHRGVATDKKSYDKYLKENKYPELFSQAERDAGGRQSLINIIKPLMLPNQISKGSIYEKLAKWPIACYMTTNYDNELKNHLDQIQIHYEVRRNRKEDFYVIRDGVSNLILKLHSDLDYPNELVITSADYQHYYVDAGGQYYRDKLRQIFEMFDVLIIGHSLSDPDIAYILKMAKETASPLRPVYMVAADYTQAEGKEYREKYNIVLLEYLNKDGQHTQLKQQLATVDKFIVPRGSNGPMRILGDINPEEAQAASSLFLHRKLQPLQTINNISMLVLSTLPCDNETGISDDDLFIKYPLSTFTRNGINHDAVRESLVGLVKELLVEKVSTGYRLTTKGTKSPRMSFKS